MSFRNLRIDIPPGLFFFLHPHSRHSPVVDQAFSHGLALKERISRNGFDGLLADGSD